MIRVTIITAYLLLVSCTSLTYRYSGSPVFPKIQKGDKLSEGLEGQSTDSTYGYQKSNPVQVGGGPANERLYLSMLSGPDGQDLHFARLGSFEGPKVLVDGYEVSYDGLDSSIIIYIDMYTYKNPLAPVGLKIKPEFDRRLQQQ